MNKTIIAILFLGIIGCSFAAVSQGDYSDKDHPGKCNYYGRILDPGTHQSPDRCIRISCGSNGHVETASCGKKMVQDCVPGDLVDKTIDYPACCLQYFDCNGKIVKF
ncbi:hypothetical protein ACFFRR_010089 [Megaselia abdita]